jgi:hypothetical protein
MSPGPRGALAATGPDHAERIARTMNFVALGQLHKHGAQTAATSLTSRRKSRVLAWATWEL